VVLAGAGAVWLAAHEQPTGPPEPGAILTLVVGASLLGCAGLLTKRFVALDLASLDVLIRVRRTFGRQCWTVCSGDVP